MRFDKLKVNFYYFLHRRRLLKIGKSLEWIWERESLYTHKSWLEDSGRDKKLYVNEKEKQWLCWDEIVLYLTDDIGNFVSVNIVS